MNHQFGSELSTVTTDSCRNCHL